MNIFDTVKISTHALRVNKVRSLLTMLGVVIGVASVILLVSIVSGLGRRIREELNSFGANLIIIFPGSAAGGRGPGGSSTNRFRFEYADLMQERVPEITDVVSAVTSSGIVKYRSKEVPQTSIYSATGNYFRVLNITVTEGRTFTTRDSGNVAVIGTTVKDELFGEASPIGKEIIVKDRRFTVIGLQKKRGSFLGVDDDKVVIISLPAGRSLLGADKPGFFFLKGSEDSNVDIIKAKVEKVLLKEMDTDDFTVSTQEDTIALVGRILGVLSVGLGGVAAISLVVGGVGIMNIMLVSVTERTREIGLRKAIGAQSSDILMQFLTEAIVLSVFGGVLGVAIGVGLSVLVDRVLTTEVSVPYVLMAFGFSVIIGVIFGVAPAVKASRLEPIDALRYE